MQIYLINRHTGHYTTKRFACSHCFHPIITKYGYIQVNIAKVNLLTSKKFIAKASSKPNRLEPENAGKFL